MSKSLPAKFFERDRVLVARDLIGKFIVREYQGTLVRLEITETEGYGGEEDLASHARFGNTGRSSIMYGKPGVIYIYLVYGLHLMLNVVTGKKGEASAVLIRGVEKVNGPGKLTKLLRIDKSMNGKSASRRVGLWFENSKNAETIEVRSLPRIGIDYAGPLWSKKPHRFIKKAKPLPKINLVGL